MSEQTTPTYTYDPANIFDKNINQMRFELGDTIVDMGAITSPLCDEEYKAVIAAESNWKRAKVKCLEAIVMKLSYEVDTSVSGLSYSLSQRAEAWRKMLSDLKKKTIVAIPSGNKSAIYGKNEPHYFETDLHANPRK